jgi:glycosyltransferase
LAEVEKDRTGIAVVISEPDKGLYDAMNKGIALSSGDIVGILNSDDYYPGPDILRTVVQCMNRKNVDSCYGDLVYVDAVRTDHVKRYWKSGEYHLRKFYWGWMPPHPTFFVRRGIYKKLGYFNLDLRSAADYELMLRFLLKAKISTTYIPEVIVHMRTGGVSNKSILNRWNANKMDRRAWVVNGLKPYPWTTFLKPVSKILQYIVHTKIPPATLAPKPIEPVSR